MLADNGCVKYVINGRFLGMRMTGVQRFAYEVVAELDRIAEPEKYEIAVPSNVKTVPVLKNIKIVYFGKLKNLLWEHFSFPLYVIRKKAIPLNLCNTAPLLKPGIATIHDMKVFAHPEFFSKKFVLWYKILFGNIARRSSIIITVSKFSKQEIVKYLKVDEKRVLVLANGWQHLEKVVCDDGILKRNNVEKNDYFFSMSSMDPNKNFKWIADVAKKNPTQKFVIAGGVNAKVFSRNFEFETPENMIFLGYVSDGEAKALMQNCKAFLFPSFYEGFGIPPLEALSTGAQVVVSDVPVMHEIFGNTVHYISPNDLNVDLEGIMKGAVDSPKLVLEKYSWEKNGKMLLDVLKK